MSEHTDDRVRASDAEREEVAARLRTAIGEGRLTLAEGEQRLAAAYGATHRDELGGLTADLPGQSRPAPTLVPAAGHTGPDRPPHRGGMVRHPSDLPSRVFGLLVLAAVLTGIWAVTPGRFFWPAIPLVILTVKLTRHAGRRRHHAWRHPTPSHRGIHDG